MRSHFEIVVQRPVKLTCANLADFFPVLTASAISSYDEIKV